MDADAVAQIHEQTERIGIDILTGVSVTGISKAGNELEIAFDHDGQSKTLSAVKIANGAGRVADVDELDLNAGGIDHSGLISA